MFRSDDHNRCCTAHSPGCLLAPCAVAALMKPAGEDMLQKWSVSQRVNSSKADKDDATLIDRVAAPAEGQAP